MSAKNTLKRKSFTVYNYIVTKGFVKTYRGQNCIILPHQENTRKWKWKEGCACTFIRTCSQVESSLESSYRLSFGHHGGCWSQTCRNAQYFFTTKTHNISESSARELYRKTANSKEGTLCHNRLLKRWRPDCLYVVLATDHALFCRHHICIACHCIHHSLATMLCTSSTYIWL